MEHSYRGKTAWEEQRKLKSSVARRKMYQYSAICPTELRKGSASWKTDRVGAGYPLLGLKSIEYYQ
jgi:hypothetical protein